MIYLRGMNSVPIQRRQLGASGPVVFPLALGGMGMSDLYGHADEGESIATIHAALDAGIALLDTGDYYAAGRNELLIGRALRDRRDKALVSVKFGAVRGPDLVKAGYVRAIGLSEVGPDTIRRAQAVHPISDLQIEYSLLSRAPEMRIFPLLAELGIGVTAYGVLSRGLLSGSKPTSPGDFREILPRFTGENRERNQRLIEALQKQASGKGVTVSQLAIAWVLARGDGIVPLIGARTRAQLAESLGALQIELSPSDVARIEDAVPPSAVAGPRYDEHQMRILDSER